MKEAEKKAAKPAEKRDERRESYARPELQKHGKVENLTQGLPGTPGCSHPLQTA